MTTPRVFISFSHDSPAHETEVLALANRLRRDGVDAWIDMFEPAPAMGWPRWMQQQIARADFVVLVCTATYKRHFEGQDAPGAGCGVKWEGMLLTQLAYEAGGHSETIIPIYFAGDSNAVIPEVFRPYTFYELPDDYEALYRRLTSQPAVVPAALGPLSEMPPVSTGITDSSRERGDDDNGAQTILDQGHVGGDLAGGNKIVHGDEVHGDKHIHNIYATPDAAGRRRWLMVTALGLGPLLLALLLLLSSTAATGAVCRVPGIRTLCAALAIGGVAGVAERNAWCTALADLPAPDGLRAYLRAYRSGVYASDAESRLKHDCKREQDVHWQPKTERLRLFVPLSAAGFATEDAARRNALQRGDRIARDTLCSNFRAEVSDVYRLDEVNIDPGNAWRCQHQDGWRCGFDGMALCAVRARQTRQTMRCAGGQIHEDCVQ